MRFFPLSFIVISLSVCPSNVLVALFVRFRLTPSLFGVHCSLVWFNTHTLSLYFSVCFFLVVVNLLRAFWKVSCAYWLNEVDTASVQHVKYQWKKQPSHTYLVGILFNQAPSSPHPTLSLHLTRVHQFISMFCDFKCDGFVI